MQEFLLNRKQNIVLGPAPKYSLEDSQVKFDSAFDRSSAEPAPQWTAVYLWLMRTRDHVAGANNNKTWRAFLIVLGR